MRAVIRIASAAALWLAVGPTASAQPGAAPPATSTGTGFRAKDLLGASIGLQGGGTAGTIEDMVANNDGVIEYLIVNNGGKLVTVPWDAAKFNWSQPAVTTPPATTTTRPVARPAVAVLSITPQQYQAIPTYTTTTYPNFYAPTYRTDIYKAYGLTPGQERRLERRIERRP